MTNSRPSDTTSAETAALYGGSRPPGDVLGIADVPGGASVIHVALIRLRRLLTREQTQVLERTAGISIPEWRILYLLATFGPMSQSELLKKTVTEQAQASRVMKAMAASGLTVLERDPNDLRRWTCSLTERGRHDFERADPVMQARRHFLDSTLTEEEFLQFTEFANRIAERVQRAMNDVSVYEAAAAGKRQELLEQGRVK